MDARPKPPFVSWPVQVADPAFGFVWFAQPAVLLTQSTVERGTIEAARRIHDYIDQALEHAADEVAAQGGIFIIHDFRSMAGYDKEARLEFIARMRRRKPGYSRGSIVAIRTDKPLLRMAVQAVNLVSAVAVKAPLEMVWDPEPAVEQYVARRPRRGEPFPGGAAALQQG